MLFLDVNQSVQRAGDELATWVPRLIGALLILLIGWIVARVIAKVVRRALGSAGIDRVLDHGRAGELKQQYAPQASAAGLIARIAFWFVFALAVMAAVSALGVQALSDFVS